MSWKPEVQTVNDPEWYGNGLRFATEHEALTNAADLMGRRRLVRDYRAVESADPVNYAWVDGKLVHLITTELNAPWTDEEKAELKHQTQ